MNETWHPGTRALMSARGRDEASEWRLIAIEVRDQHTSCPSQWFGRMATGCAFYIRFRHDWLELRVSEPGGSDRDAVRGATVFAERLSDDNSGVIGWDEVCAAIGIEDRSQTR